MKYEKHPNANNKKSISNSPSYHRHIAKLEKINQIKEPTSNCKSSFPLVLNSLISQNPLLDMYIQKHNSYSQIDSQSSISIKQYNLSLLFSL